MLWEMQHRILHQAAADWLAEGRIAGRKTGFFAADAQGHVAAQ